MCVALVACAAASCARDDSPELLKQAGSLVGAALAGDETVANVDGRPIYASEIAAVARAQSCSAKEALETLVTAETLVSEAARRGLDRSREAHDAVKRETVRRLLNTDFESIVGPSAVSMRDVRRAYNLNKATLDHSVYVDTWHILVQSKKTDSAETQAHAEALAKQILERAQKVPDLDAFKALATSMATAEFPTLRLEHIVTARDGWVETGYSFPAHDKLKRPGDVTPARTSYGFHTIYLLGRIPEKHVSFDDAIPIMQNGLLPELRRARFMPYVENITAKHDVKVFPERIPKDSEE